jgi:hypothetical protein
MKYFKIQNLIFGLLLFLSISKVIEMTIPKGMSEEEHLAKMKYQILENKLKNFYREHKLTQRENEITFKEITNDSIAVWNGDRKYQDSIRSIYNPR